MFPVGDTLSRDVAQRYSYVKVLHSLAMDYTRVAEVGTVKENHAEDFMQVPGP